ncbi:MAG: nucleotide exchange factor GrpE [Syntrophobacterales bacterium]|jgi:molecular chaperone GrpE|nr:nucleotide exchange factor GrpE [Syntrophobacterales bacterium]
MTGKNQKKQEEDYLNFDEESDSEYMADSLLTPADGEIEAAIQEEEKKSDENYEKYLRALADLENFKKRAAKEKQDTIKYGNEALIKDLLPIIDGMDRALAYSEQSDDFASFKEGLQMLQEQLCRCLEKHGVEAVDALDQPFDPYLHEALMMVESADHEANHVVTQMEKGYLLNGRLIRPAKVCVCKK